MIGEVETIRLNHALNAKRRQDSFGPTVKTMVTLLDIVHVRGVKQNLAEEERPEWDWLKRK